MASLPLPTTAPGPHAPTDAPARTARSYPLPLPQRLRQQWRNFVRHVNTASGSTPSETVTDPGVSASGGSAVLVRRAKLIAGEMVARDEEEMRLGKHAQGGIWDRRRRRKARAAGGEGGVTEGAPTTQGDEVDDKDEREPEKVEMLVVDQGFSSSDGWARRFGSPTGPGYHPSAPTDDGQPLHQTNVPQVGSRTYSNTDAHHAGDMHGIVGGPEEAGHWGVPTIGVWFRWRLWPVIYRFFELGFITGKEESAFQREAWYNQKRISLCGSLFYILMAITTLAFSPRPHDIVVQVCFYGLSFMFTLILPLMIIYDWPKKRRLVYQVWLFGATWLWCIAGMADLKYCGYYAAVPNCGKKEFNGLMYSSVAIPTIAMFGMGMTRVTYLLGIISFNAIAGAFAAVYSTTWARNLFNFTAFSLCVLVVHYAKEKADRRVWSLRDQLKKQFRATQKAQVAEAKAAESKKSFSSYVFHEVRVPLNTALLALQNLEDSGCFSKSSSQDTDIEWNALVGSLVMMQKVLNDVLDFSRMDAGKLETVYEPYYFHRTLRSLQRSFELAAESKGLEFETYLDPRIDEVLLDAARAAARQAGNDRWEDITEGASVGDEMRLRQIVTNLCSNATKFTPPGGKVSLRTRLVFPAAPVVTHTTSSDTNAEPKLSTRLASRAAQQPVNTTVVRIEIEDNGVGISHFDMGDSRLFSPYVQTEIGRRQGGKGSGLGLALVKSIVRLSKGRLGVISTKHKGSMFWIELPLGAGQTALALTEDLQRSVSADHGVLEKGERGMRERRSVWMMSRSSDQEKQIVKAQAALDKGRALHGELVDIEKIGLGGEKRVRVVPHTPDDHMGSFELPLFFSSDSQPSSTSTAMTGSFLSRPPLFRSDNSELSVGSARSSGGGRGSVPVTPPITDPAVGLGDVAEEDTDLTPQPTPASTLLPPPRPGPSRTQTSTSLTMLGNSAPRPASANSDASRGSRGNSSQVSPAASTTLPLNILLVDDDPLTRKLMSRMMSKWGHVCSEAADGHAALVKLGAASEQDLDGVPSAEDVKAAEHRYDLIMLDNFMPVKTGVETVRWLRSLGRQDMVCGCTANAERSDQLEYREAGLNELLTKPINQRDLMRICSEADARRQARVKAPKGSPTLAASRSTI